MGLEYSAWRLTHMVSDGRTLDMEAMEEDDQSAITAAFEPDDTGALRITGSGGCNRYTATCSPTSETLAIGSIASTRMMCPPEVMEREARYFRLLANAQRYEQDGAHLAIFCQTGELHFARLKT